MKKLYNEGVISMLACNRGFMFTAKQLDEQPAQSGDKSVVFFRQHSFDNGQESLVTRTVYLMTKFGSNYEFFAENLNDYINCKAVTIDNSYMLIANVDGFATLYSKQRAVKWSGSLKHKGFAPADIVAAGEYLWCSYPEGNAIIKYNIHSMQQVFRVGGSMSGDIIEPYGLWLNDNNLIITSSANNKITALNLDTFYAEVLHECDEPVIQYMKIDSNEVILTKSGIYKL